MDDVNWPELLASLLVEHGLTLGGIRAASEDFVAIYRRFYEGDQP